MDNDQTVLSRVQRTGIQATSGTGVTVFLDWLLNDRLHADIPSYIILIVAGALTVIAAKIMIIGENKGWWPNTRPQA